MAERADLRRIAREAGGSETADLRVLAEQVDGIADRVVGAVEDQVTLRRAATELRVYAAAQARESEAREALERAREVVDAQAEDDGLWFIAETASEAYLQQELRRVHAAIERLTDKGGTK